MRLDIDRGGLNRDCHPVAVGRKCALDAKNSACMCVYMCVCICVCVCVCICVGLARTICTRCIYGIFGRDFTKFTVKYGVYIYGSGQPYICVVDKERKLLLAKQGSSASARKISYMQELCVYVCVCVCVCARVKSKVRPSFPLFCLNSHLPIRDLLLLHTWHVSMSSLCTERANTPVYAFCHEVHACLVTMH